MSRITLELNDEIIERIRERAANRGVSMEEEARSLLMEASSLYELPTSTRKPISRSEWKRNLEEFREKIGPVSDSTEHIRELRDSR